MRELRGVSSSPGPRKVYEPRSSYLEGDRRADVTTADPAPERFKAFRAKFGMSQQQAGDLFGVRPQTWSKWERGVRPQIAARLLVTLLVAKPELMDLLPNRADPGRGCRAAIRPKDGRCGAVRVWSRPRTGPRPSLGLQRPSGPPQSRSSPRSSSKLRSSKPRRHCWPRPRRRFRCRSDRPCGRSGPRSARPRTTPTTPTACRGRPRRSRARGSPRAAARYQPTRWRRRCGR